METLEAESPEDISELTPLESVGSEANASLDDRHYQAEQLAMDIQDALQGEDPDLDFEAIVTSEDMDLVALLAANRSAEIASMMEDTQEDESLLFRLSEKLNSTKATKFVTKLGIAATGGIIGIIANRLTADNSLLETALAASGSAVTVKFMKFLPEASTTLGKEGLSAEQIKAGVTEWMAEGIKSAQESANQGQSDLLANDADITKPEQTTIADMDKEVLEVAELSEAFYKDMTLEGYIKLVSSFLIETHAAEVASDKAKLANEAGEAIAGSALEILDVDKLGGDEILKPASEALKTVRGIAAKILGRVVASKLFKLGGEKTQTE